MHIDVLCDGQHLPFRSNSFSTVYSSHVVEHVDDPVLMVRELLRVARDHVTIKTPHLFSYASKGVPYFSEKTGFTYHIHSWTASYWKRLLSKFKHSVKTMPNLHTPFWWIPLKSIEMIIEVHK